MLVQEITSKESTIGLRIPGWCKRADVKINGKSIYLKLESGKYTALRRTWKAGDKIELKLDMPATLLESNPLVEETKNQVVVKRGPIVYCLESADLKPGQKVFDISIPANTQWQAIPSKIDNGNIMALQGTARIVQHDDWKNSLYREVNTKMQPVSIRMIPYYAWANRGESDMTVWLPLIRQ